LLSRHGYNMVDWGDSGMQFWAVSDLSPGELQTFARLHRAQNIQSPPG
jgi:anti-sigma factor RsiW